MAAATTEQPKVMNRFRIALCVSCGVFTALLMSLGIAVGVTISQLEDVSMTLKSMHLEALEEQTSALAYLDVDMGSFDTPHGLKADGGTCAVRDGNDLIVEAKLAQPFEFNFGSNSHVVVEITDGSWSALGTAVNRTGGLKLGVACHFHFKLNLFKTGIKIPHSPRGDWDVKAPEEAQAEECQPVKGAKQPQLLRLSDMPNYQVHGSRRDWLRAFDRKDNISADLWQDLLISVRKGGAANFIFNFLQKVDTSIAAGITYRDDSIHAFEVTTTLNTKVKAVVDPSTCATTVKLPVVVAGNLNIPGLAAAIGASAARARATRTESDDHTDYFMRVGSDGHVGDQQFKLAAKTPNAAIARAFGPNHVLGWRSEGNASLHDFISHDMHRRLTDSFKSDTVKQGNQYFTGEFRQHVYLDANDFFGFEAKLQDGQTLLFTTGARAVTDYFLDDGVEAELNMSLGWAKSSETFTARVFGMFKQGGQAELGASAELKFELPTNKISLSLEASENSKDLVNIVVVLDPDGDGADGGLAMYATLDVKVDLEESDLDQFDINEKMGVELSLRHEMTSAGNSDTHVLNGYVKEKGRTDEQEDFEGNINADITFDHATSPAKVTGEIMGEVLCAGESGVTVSESKCSESMLGEMMGEMEVGEEITETIDTEMDMDSDSMGEDMELPDISEPEFDFSDSGATITMKDESGKASQSVVATWSAEKTTVTIKDGDTDMAKFDMESGSGNMKMSLKAEGETLLNVDYVETVDGSSTDYSLTVDQPTGVLTASGSTGGGIFDMKMDFKGEDGEELFKLETFKLEAVAKIAKIDATIALGEEKLGLSGELDAAADPAELSMSISSNDNVVASVQSSMKKDGDRMSGDINFNGEDGTAFLTLKGSSDTDFLTMDNAPDGWMQLSSWVEYESSEPEEPTVKFSTYFVTNPDGDLSRIGMETKVTMEAELGIEEGTSNEIESFTTLTFAFPYDSGIAEAYTDFDASMELAKVSDFDQDIYVEALAETADIDSSSVEVVSTTFTIVATVEFSAAVPEDKAKTAIAQAFGVQPSQVTLTAVRRRLSDTGGGSTTYDVTIACTSQAEASNVESNMDDTAALDTALADAGVDATATTITVNAVDLTVSTKLVSKEGKTIVTPTAAEVTSGYEAKGGKKIKITGVTQTAQGTQGFGAASTSGDGVSSSGASHDSPALAYTIMSMAGLLVATLRN